MVGYVAGGFQSKETDVKRLLSAASAVTLLTMSAPAFAQAPGGVAPSVPPLGQQGGANGADGGDIPLETIVAALNDPQVEIGELSSIPATAEIQVVDLQTYLQADGAATLIPAITTAEGEKVAIQRALQANSEIQAQLNSRNIDPADVVGFGVDGGKILLFTNSSPGDANPGAGAGGVIQRNP
jgi:hypothetical protein